MFVPHTNVNMEGIASSYSAHMLSKRSQIYLFLRFGIDFVISPSKMFMEFIHGSLVLYSQRQYFFY